MLEWLKRHAWKACIGQKPIPGSNPGLSASRKPDKLKPTRQAFNIYTRKTGLVCICFWGVGAGGRIADVAGVVGHYHRGDRQGYYHAYYA